MIYRNGKVRDDTLGHYGPDLYTRSIIEFIKENRDGRFFAFYSMALAHEVTDDLETLCLTVLSVAMTATPRWSRKQTVPSVDWSGAERFQAAREDAYSLCCGQRDAA